MRAGWGVLRSKGTPSEKAGKATFSLALKAAGIFGWGVPAVAVERWPWGNGTLGMTAGTSTPLNDASVGVDATW